MDLALPRPLVVPWRLLPAVLYLLPASLAAAALFTDGRWWAILALVPAMFGMWGIVASSAILRLSYVGTGFSDQMVVTEAARERVLAGLSPYGVGYSMSEPPGSPYPYGPLAMLSSVPIELVASIVLLVVLARARRPITLALYGGLPFSIYLASSGNNDYLVTLLLSVGLLSLPKWYGGALIGLSAAVKPYTAAFLPAALGAGSWPALLAAGVTFGLGWLPALWWGGFLDSLAMLNRMQAPSMLRYLAIPFGMAGFRYGILACCAAFALLTLTSQNWSLGYLVPLGVAAGISLETKAGLESRP